MARWKARGRLYIRRNWTFFAISYGWDVMSGNRSKSAFVEGVGHFERTFQREGSVAHQPLFGIRVAEWLPFVWYKISAVRHLVLSQCTRVTDRRTDRQNYDSQDRPRICSRGKIWGIDPSIPPNFDAYGLKAYRATSHGVEFDSEQTFTAHPLSRRKDRSDFETYEIINCVYNV